MFIIIWKFIHTFIHRQAGKQAGRQADRQTGRQTDRQTDRQTYWEGVLKIFQKRGEHKNGRGYLKRGGNKYPLRTMFLLFTVNCGRLCLDQLL